MERTWNEVVMAYFKTMYQYLLEMTSKYGIYLVILFLQPASLLFPFSLTSQSVKFIFNFGAHYKSSVLGIELMYVPSVCFQSLQCISEYCFMFYNFLFWPTQMLI
jgi:hypothetical protein